MLPPSRLGVTKDNLSISSRMIVQFAKNLPDPRGNYLLYVDNFFMNLKLATVLRRFGVAICGTCKQGSGFSEELLRLRACSTKSKDWGKQSLDVVQNVACIAWQDNNVVQFMTTGHTMKQIKEEFVQMPARKRVGIPKECVQKTDVSACINGESPLNLKLRITWNERLPKPFVIHDYNMNMGGVDRNAQMRTYYSIKRPSVKFWHILFDAFIELAVQNAFRMHKLHFLTVEPNQFAMKQSHEAFIEDLACMLIQRHGGRARLGNFGGESNTQDALHPAEHRFERLRTKRQCWACKQNGRQRPHRRPLQAIDPNIQTERQKNAVPETSFQCIACRKPCCRSKFGEQNKCWNYLHRFQRPVS